MMSGRPTFVQRLAKSGHESQVPGGQRRGSDDVDVIVGSLLGDFFRRLEQRTDVDVESQVGEGGRDDLLAAVVAVLAHLRDQNAWTTTVLGGEFLDKRTGH